MTDFIPVKDITKRTIKRDFVIKLPVRKQGMDKYEYFKSTAPKTTMLALIDRSGLSRAQIARRLGISKRIAWKWTDETFPQYARAYVQLFIEYQKLRP